MRKGLLLSLSTDEDQKQRAGQQLALATELVRGWGQEAAPAVQPGPLAPCHCNRQREGAAPLGSWKQYVLNNYYLWYSVYLNSLTPSKIPGNNYRHYFVDEEIETQDIKGLP